MREFLQQNPDSVAISQQQDGDSFKYRKYCSPQAILVYCTCPGNLYKTVPRTDFYPDSFKYYTGQQKELEEVSIYFDILNISIRLILEHVCVP